MKKGERMSESQKLRISKTIKAKNPEIDYHKHASYFLQNHGWRYVTKVFKDIHEGIWIAHPLTCPQNFKNGKYLVRFCDKFYGKFWEDYKKICKSRENRRALK